MFGSADRLATVVVLLAAVMALAPERASGQGGASGAREAGSGDQGRRCFIHKIRSALRKRCDLEFFETPLQDVTLCLAKKCGIDNIVLDVRALDAVGIGSDTPVTRRLKGVSVRSALRMILWDLELAYVIRDDALVITTAEEAEAHPVARVYEVSDLVDAPPAREPPSDRPAGNGEALERLVDAVVTTVAPDSWDEAGGPGTICGLHYGDKYVLVVSQTEEVHDAVEGLLAMLRHVRPGAASYCGCCNGLPTASR